MGTDGIAVIICNYNYGSFLKETVKSCLNQSVKNTPFIIDDGSTDGSPDQARHVLGKLIKNVNEENIKIEHREKGVLILLSDNNGPSIARNVGIIYAIKSGKYKYIQILDADDEMYSNKIEELLKGFNSPNIAAVYADYDVLNLETNNKIREYKKPFSVSKLMQECIVHSGSLIKTEAIIKIFQQYKYIYHPELRCAEDYNLWISLVKQGWQINHIPKSLTLVREHKNNSTNSVDKNIWNQCLLKSDNYMHNNFITEAKRKDLNTTIILYGSNCNIRMTSFPPKPLLNINKKKLIDFQLSIINNSFIKNEIILCGGFKFDSLVNGNYKLIENQLFDKNNECDDIRLAVNIAKYKNILLIDQSTFFNKNTLKSIYDNSFIICSEDKNDYVGVNHENDLLTSLYYNDNKLKWKNISFIHEKNFKDFKKLLDSKNYTNKFLFELLNDMAGSNKINIFKKDNITTIYSPKELRELNENFNT